METESTTNDTPPPAPPPPRARPWSVETRRWIVIGLLALGMFFVYQLREILPPIIFAFLLAYLLNPLVVLLQRRARLPRPLALAVLYLALVALLMGLVLWSGPALFRQVRATILGLDETLRHADAVLHQMTWLEALGIHADANSLLKQFGAELRALAATMPRLVAGAASGILSTVLALVLSLYLLLEAETIGRNIEHAIPEEYREEWRNTKAEFNRIWSSFLRGQVLLALIIGVIVTVVLTILGVPNALLLGLLAGFLEVIPNLGPILAMIPAVLIALLRGSTVWAIDPLPFALLVVGAYFVIQQLENHLIVPKVIGSSVDLPPVVILIGALAGASLAGVLGIFLAAPMLATGRVVAKFLLRKLLERPPSDPVGQ
ncbi:MAG: AI-2E family transporter [Chloroflexi bacterium]|nr:AI-2E family transporter [Chloroflexota bacterium]